MLMRPLSGLLHVRGLVSGQRITRAVVSMPIFLALFAVVASALAAAPAFAARGHVFERSFGEEGEGAGQFKEPSGVAVNQESGDVYVVDSGNKRVECSRRRVWRRRVCC
jgi:NHL repeat